MNKLTSIVQYTTMFPIFDYFVDRAPTDCLQYFTGKTNTVYSYNFAGAQVCVWFLDAVADYYHCGFEFKTFHDQPNDWTYEQPHEWPYEQPHDRLHDLPKLWYQGSFHSWYVCILFIFCIPQLLLDMDYTNCVRTEKGYCAIEWKEKTGATPGMMNHH